jgi:hypothetical protein
MASADIPKASLYYYSASIYASAGVHTHILMCDGD